jgi:hypothetical protein
MTLFLDLAPEPFSQILSYLNTRELINLWRCGDLAMEWRLSKGKAARNVRFDFTKTSKHNWPSIASQFCGLEQFSYISSHDAPDCGLKGHHLATLPQDLKKLYLDCESALRAFRELQMANPSHFRSIPDLFLRFKNNKLCLDFEMPRNLKSLALTDYHQTSLSLPISVLPKGLTHLFCYIKTLEMDESMFPSSLVDLHLSLAEMPRLPVAFHHLPVGLESLYLNIGSQFTGLVLENWDAIHKLTNLKTLQIPVGVPLTIKEVQLLPQSLETLELTNIVDIVTEEWCIQILKALLPRKLKILKGIFPEEITPSIVRHMPRTLVKLDRDYTFPASELISMLPDSIEDLKVEGDDLFLISSFPSKLQSLTIQDIPYHSASVLKSMLALLPDSLKTLDFGFDFEGRLTTDMASTLPRGLEELIWISSVPLNGEMKALFKALPRTLKQIEMLPTYLDHASISPARTTPQSSLMLPRQLEALHIGCLEFTPGKMAEWILNLPNGLRSLSISIKQIQLRAFDAFGALEHLQYLSIRVLLPPKGGWSKFVNLQSLPRKLTSLSFWDIYSKDSDLTDESFRGAAPSITSLEIQSSPLLTIGCLSHLPNLSELRYQPNNERPSWFTE